MTSASLFSGAGLADCGLERAGFSSLWFCEIEAHPAVVLRSNFPGVPIYPDVRSFPAETVPVPDILWWSPPCQDLSVAGKRAGLEGSRSGLFYDAAAHVRTLARRGLRFAVMEQVPGLLSSNGTDDIHDVLLTLLRIGAADVAWRTLDSQYLGVAQRRERMFFVLDFGGECAGEILALAEGLQGHPAPCRQAGEGAVPGVASCLTSSGGTRCDLETETFIPDVSPVIRAKANCSQRADMEVFIPTVSHPLRADGFDASEDGTGRGTPIVPVGASTLSSSGAGIARTGNSRTEADFIVGFTCKDSGADASEVSPTLRSMGHADSHANGGGQVAMAFGWNKSQSQTMRVSTDTTDALQASATSNPSVYTRHGVRRLMPVEGERLQGVPDGWTKWGIKADGTRYELPDGPRYKALGNGVTANVSEWIGRRAAKCLEVKQ